MYARQIYMPGSHHNLSTEEEKVALEALGFIKQSKREIIDKFASDNECPSVDNPISMFMAGSPGAGKTEFSKRLIEYMISQGSAPIMRIDPDEIRGLIPQYTGNNSYIFQRATSKGVDLLHDHALDKNKNFVLDGTFSNYDIARSNVNRSIEHKRTVVIVYLYQDPKVAWDFTKKREIVEHRNIPKDAFIRELFAAKENVNSIKREFGSRLRLWLIERDLSKQTDILQSPVNIDNVDNYLTISYTSEQLESELS